MNTTKLAEWDRVNKALKEMKVLEAKLRSEVLGELYNFGGEADLREGTENLELDNGYKLKATFKLSRKLENKNHETEEALAQIANFENGILYAERLVKWSPELSVSEYKKLPTNIKQIIDSCVTSKAATPSLEIVEPKK
jgi:hypothetical protein